MFVGEIHVSQGFFNAFLHELRHFVQLQLAEFFRYQVRLLARGFFIFLRVDRFQHGGDIADMFPWAHGKGIAIPVNYATLPSCLREKVSEDFIKPDALVRDDQPYSYAKHTPFREKSRLSSVLRAK